MGPCPGRPRAGGPLASPSSAASATTARSATTTASPWLPCPAPPWTCKPGGDAPPREARRGLAATSSQ
eukprot:6837983-Lingulodinium_polyedra.AAC.1